MSRRLRVDAVVRFDIPHSLDDRVESDDASNGTISIVGHLSSPLRIRGRPPELVFGRVFAQLSRDCCQRIVMNEE